MRLIGLAGLARSGKDSVAKHLAREYGFVPLAFADPLRDMLDAAFQIQTQYTQILKEAKTECGFSYRELMQTFGDAGRGMAADFWVNELDRRLQRIKADLGQDVSVVISDVRYLNEAFWVRLRGQLWHVERPDIDPTQTRAHSSEAGIVPLAGEAHLRNDRDLHGLLEQVDRMLML